ncbi:MAG: hypothetical protein AAF085_10025 [Planctomycetota bacterium]
MKTNSRAIQSLMLAASLGLASTTSAQYTQVKAPPSSELSHAELLSGALGQTFNAAGRGNRDLAGGSIYASRVSDSNDQIWSGGQFTASIIGREAGYRHTFGYVQDRNFNSILRTDDTDGSMTFTIDDDFTWAIQNDKQNGGDLWSSKKSHNRDRKDHMVTYAIYDNDSFAGFALFFEDLPRWHADRDYNDAAVLLSIVPSPQAAGLALAGLGGVGLATGRRRRDS